VKKLDYVISACGMMGVFTPDHQAPWFPHYHKATLSLMRSLKQQIASSCHSTTPLVSTLYNAYTEKNHVAEFKRLDNLGSDSVYADSGGLQIVTAGKSITEEIKKEIYKTQTYADYAMCFDVIALGSVSLTRTRNERSNVGNKIFKANEHIAAAHATGDNIKAQASYFRTTGAKTKVIIIVQGNNSQDMLDFYNGIASRLSPEDYENIGGMAIADTCIGNGELESIEMLRAAKMISEICHPNIKRHLHVLGVGSISRMRPILYLLKSGYLSEFDRISYDSSSHTSTFQYGLLKLNGTCRSIGTTKTHLVDKHFRNVYNLFSDMFIEFNISEDRFIHNLFPDERSDWKFSTIKNRILNNASHDDIVTTLLCNAAHTYYQIHNFVTNLDQVMTHKLDKFDDNKDLAMNKLLGITTTEQLNSWIDLYKNQIKSKRIARNSELATLEGFFS